VDDQSTDLEQHAAPPGFPAVCPFPRDQLTMPAQQGVRRRDRGDLPQSRSAYPVCSSGQPLAIGICQVRAPGSELAAQEPVFFDQVGNCLPLQAIQPTGQHTQHHL
jgi:hypothetical protein